MFKNNLKKFCSKKCYINKRRTGYITKQGYKEISIKGRKILEHRFIMENYLKRKLKKQEHIHHLNRNKLDNRIENLIPMSSSEHIKLHWKLGHIR